MNFLLGILSITIGIGMFLFTRWSLKGTRDNYLRYGMYNGYTAAIGLICFGAIHIYVYFSNL